MGPRILGTGLLLAVSSGLACHATEEGSEADELRRIGAVDWYLDYDRGRRAALELERPLWVHFGEDPG